MEAKLDKIFNIFQDKNNETLFELCVRQIVEIYKDSPSSIYYLLKKAMRLLFSTTKDSYLQLKHRQVAAGIIEKTYRYYTQRLQKFINTDLANDEDIDILSLFHMEKITPEQQQKDLLRLQQKTLQQQLSQQEQQVVSNDSEKANNQIEVEETEKPSKKKNSKKNSKTEKASKKGKKNGNANGSSSNQNEQKAKNEIPQIKNNIHLLKTIEQVKNQWNVAVNGIDYDYMIKHEDPLVAREQGFYDVQLQSQRESRELEEEILSKMGLSADLNPTNLQGIWNSHFNVNFSDKHKELSMLDQENLSQILDDDTQSTQVSTQNGNKKKGKRKGASNNEQGTSNVENSYGESVKKKIKTESNGGTARQKSGQNDLNDNEGQMQEENGDDISMKECIGLNLFVPFNNIFRQCLKNLLSRTWEIRHYSAMVLKGFLKENIEFLEFEHKIYTKDIDPRLLEENSQHQLFHSILNTLQIELKKFLGAEQNVQDKIENYLSRSMIILILDQLADYSGKISDIMIRKVACDMITLILKNSNYISDKFRYQILIKIQHFLQKSIQQVGQRIITQTSLVLITQLLNERKDLRREIFNLFRSSYEGILNQNQDEDIIMHFSDNFLIYVHEGDWIIYEGEFISLIIEKLWNYVDIFDDISYNIKTIMSLLQECQRLGFMTEKDFSPPHIKKLFKYFFHWEEEVRRETYILLHEGLLTYQDLRIDNNEEIQLLYDLVIRGLVIEKNESNFVALIYLCQVIQKHLTADQINAGHTILINVAVSNQSCDKIIESFCEFLKSKGLRPHYNFYIKSLSNLGHFDNNIMRMQRVITALCKIAVNNLEFLQRQCASLKIQTSVNQQPNYHVQIIFVLSLMAYFIESNNVDPKIILNFFVQQELEQFMDQKNFDLWVDQVQQQDQIIFQYLSSIDQLTSSAPKIRNSEQITGILDHQAFQDQREKRQQYDILVVKCKQLIDHLNVQTEMGQKLIQNMESIIRNVDYLNERSEDYVIVIKMASIYLYIQYLVCQGLPISSMNLICRPLPRYVQIEKFQIISNLVSSSFFTLIFKIEKFETIEKLLRNSISKLTSRKKFSHYGITDPEKYEKEFVKYASKCSAINNLITKYVEKQNGISNFQFLNDILFSQISKFDHIQVDAKWLIMNKNINTTTQVLWDQLEIDSRNIYKLMDCLMNLKLFDMVCNIIKSMSNLICFLNSQMLELTDKTFAALTEQKRSKIQKVSRKIFKNLLIRSFRFDFRNAQQNQQQVTAIRNDMFKRFFIMLKIQNQIAFELLTDILDYNSKDIIDYSGIYVLQVVKCLTSPNTVIKDLAFQNLGKIITSVFLQNMNKVASQMLDPFLQKKILKGNQFILDFQNNSHFQYNLLYQPKTQLREYQMEGIKWLGFLTRYNLNGALCDDMGLGKTLQVLCVLQNEIQKDLNEGKPPKISLIVAPSSIVDHWYYEIQKFLHPQVMNPIVINSKNQIDEFMKNKDKYKIVISSYNTVYKHIETLNTIVYQFCILDEGHLIKNQNTKISQAVRSIQSEHKFLLSGTPIQNNLQELWSIFDFLMPGYLGSSKNFRDKFSKLFHTNVLNFSDEQVLFTEEQNKVLQDLHKKVMPFILRRDKKLVLKELPPKIIQDYYCYMAPKQQQFYEDLEKSQINKCEQDLEQQIDQWSKTKGFEDADQGSKIQESVLRMLSHMIQIVNHPCQYKKQERLKGNAGGLEMQKELSQYSASGKFVALKQLLVDLGFEEKESIEAEEQKVLTTNKNKVLIFSRFKETLQLICDQLLNTEFSHIKYLKLDGNVQVSKRYAIINKFNEDSECKIMLLTTSVGGLGLNLTSANVVIMFDHNYNPMNDLQAIDRAHRIGQKNTLNVYRMITKDTLEERIMGIQRFKINIANAIINLDNSSIRNLKDSNLITLFDNMVTENGYNERKETVDEMALAQTKYNPYKKIIADYEIWVTDDINKEY
ncbi:hypothetical protein ABPG72_021693 [Tetrahymena utriculariae]